jgi:GxxExxY protein
MSNHRDAEATEHTENDLTGAVIGAAIHVHRQLGPGLLEVVYAQCMRRELERRAIAFQREVQAPIFYDGVRLESQLRIDLVVEKRLIVELKAVPVILPVHTAQLLSYLRMTDTRLGLLINFNVELLVHGVRRVING